MDSFFADAEIISGYSRAQAIRDDVLIDVSRTSEAQEAGFQYPIALTSALFNLVSDVSVPGQDMKGRLWDTLYMLSLAIKGSAGGDTVHFQVIYAIYEDSRIRHKTYNLKSVCGPGDNMEPVLTVMFEEED